MIRKLLYHVVPFLLPFVVYAFYVMASKRAEARGEAFQEAPWYWLTAIGLVLSIISVVVYWYVVSEPAGGTYVPPHMEDGMIVPGKIVR